MRLLGFACLLLAWLCVSVMDAALREVSSELLAANKQLLALRALRRPGAADVQPGDSGTAFAGSLGEEVAALPAHLGWGSTAVTHALRRRWGVGPSQAQLVNEGVGKLEGAVGPTAVGPTAVGSTVVGGAGEHSSSHPTNSSIDGVDAGLGLKHYPSLGVAALAKKEAVGLRLWLACRHLDGDGRGWLRLAWVRERLTEDGAALRLCGWKRLQQVLKKGNGRFWTWTGDRLWLHGAARVAEALGVTAFSGRPVVLPLKALTTGMGAFRAHLYGAWHSGRRSSNPIARLTQRRLLYVPERSQRRYCQQAKIKRQRHFGIGQRYRKERMEERAWQQGRATFEFVDSNGDLSATEGASYVAWQLPNSYGRRHEPSRMGRQKKLQRQLTDLVNQGARGNSETELGRQYHPDGKAAVQASRTTRGRSMYWPARQERDWQLWFSLEGLE